MQATIVGSMIPVWFDMKEHGEDIVGEIKRPISHIHSPLSHACGRSSPSQFKYIRLSFDINMGIRGLKRSLASASVAITPQQVIPSETHLHIDSSGFLFYLYNKLSSNEAPKELGGSYYVLNEFIISELADLLERGFRLTAYFDGKNRMKSHTAEKRRLEQEKRWNNLYELCNSKRGRFYRYNGP
jgi:hypothetical protein